MGFFGLFGLVSIGSILWVDNLEIYADKLIVKSILGYIKKTIYFEEIKSWTEIDKKNKYLTWTDLTIYTEETRYKITSNAYHNYYLIRSYLINGKQRDLEGEKNWQKRNNLYYSIGSSLIGALLFYGAYNSYLKKDKQLSYNELSKISSVIINQPEITKGSKGSKSIKIKLKDYPNFDFDINGVAFSSTYVDDYINYVNTGDTLNVYILKDEYLKKITKEKKLNFFDKTVNYQFISVYGLTDAQKIYLSLSSYNETNQKDNEEGIWLFLGLGIFFVSMAIYLAFVKV
ncbi:hypothetical protein C3K47_17230 [Solitalea longa]|uniref:Uncharacterized protein n=1 Tax=Solitalea longa TaxID=2079460 RepID=A0A2S4ZXA7_9SPHI|nr:hypothetical protein [Solitalea longa]POY35000.1 hypothetical protein C3K47_17230 [Solitalea longa]